MELFYQKLDIFVVTSREDPYPVVALEAALFGMPILCWNRGTGTRELVEQGAGITVDYLDINAMADAVLELKNDPERREKLGEKACELAKEHDINQAGEKIYDILRNMTGT
jgi:glycosyltransferase involved in cell wall biosynthesis